MITIPAFAPKKTVDATYQERTIANDAHRAVQMKSDPKKVCPWEPGTPQYLLWMGIYAKMTGTKPPIQAPTPTGTEADACALIAQRQVLGLKKYRVPVRENPLSALEWVTHAIEEAADQLIYLMRLREELARNEDDGK